MKREDDQQLWDVLGQAAKPEISPFFARNVLRRLREQEQSGWAARGRSWFSSRKLVPLSGLALAIVGLGLFIHNPSLPQRSATEGDIVAKIDAQDYEVVADLDELLASDENSLWDDNSSL